MQTNNTGEEGYLNLLRDILENGEARDDRTGVGTISGFGKQLRFDLREGFPLLTTRKLFFGGVKSEFDWMCRQGSTNAYDLPEKAQHWWLPWAKEDGSLGKTYGYQFRKLKDGDGNSVDQIKNVTRQIIETPNCRRKIICLWNVLDIPTCQLPPCHSLLLNFYCSDDNYLSMSMHQRSADLFIGESNNIAFHALFLSYMSLITGRKPKELVIYIDDAHIYSNHVDQVKEQLSREPRSLPILHMDYKKRPESIDEFDSKKIEVLNYDPHPAIKAPVAI